MFHNFWHRLFLQEMRKFFGFHATFIEFTTGSRNIHIKACQKFSLNSKVCGFYFGSLLGQHRRQACRVQEFLCLGKVFKTARTVSIWLRDQHWYKSRCLEHYPNVKEFFNKIGLRLIRPNSELFWDYHDIFSPGCITLILISDPVSKLWYTAVIGIYYISFNTQDVTGKKLDPGKHPDRTGNIMISSEIILWLFFMLISGSTDIYL